MLRYTVGTYLHHANITAKNKATSQGGKINNQTPKAIDVSQVSEKHKISVCLKMGYCIDIFILAALLKFNLQR